ncbi:MAG: prepilin-type N-terminal cleavage/methylation domain-containing protein [Deltaproteobacteria bacterium]|nr:prepilin-type N-terminal cleavage/methylation domain-containing protein [Deltaproteobacteria bacterium]
MRDSLTRQRGFTLMEMMIALAIGAIIVTPFYFITRGMASQTTKQQMETEAMQRARMGMSVLANDFSRTGLSVSPNTVIDRKSMAPPGSTAMYRRAVVQLNRASGAPDAILITGNFLGSKIYQGLAVGTNRVIIPDLLSSGDECTRQFNSLYAYAHIVGPTGGTLDAWIESLSTTGQCTLTLWQSDLTDEGFTVGDTVWVSASQTLFYRTEDVAETVNMGGDECTGVNRQLVKYMVKFEGSSASDCSTASLGKINLALAGKTRTVVADHVEDFQVWFRPVDMVEANGRRRLDVHSYTAGDLAAASPVAEFFPDNTTYVLPATVGGGVTNSLDLSCADNYTYGPEHIRSALIRLTIRSEKADNTVDYAGFDSEGTDTSTDTDTGVGRLVRYTLTNRKLGDCKEKKGVAYKLSTVVTEVAMPNLAARSDLLM